MVGSGIEFVGSVNVYRVPFAPNKVAEPPSEVMIEVTAVFVFTATARVIGGDDSTAERPR
jgi:hypothetical protein